MQLLAFEENFGKNNCLKSLCATTHQSALCSTKKAHTRWTTYPWGWISSGCPPPYDHLKCGSPEHAGQREQIPSHWNSQYRPFTRNALCFLTSQGR